MKKYIKPSIEISELEITDIILASEIVDCGESTYEDEDGNVDVLRTITGIRKLWDVSAVSLPANDTTVISARADGEGVIAEAKLEKQKAEEARVAKEKVIAQIRILMEA